MCWDVDGEFVVATAEVLYERMAGGDTGRRPELFQPAHRAQPSLQPAMISFNTIIGVLRGHVRRGRDQFVDHPQVRAGLVGGDLDRRWTLGQRGPLRSARRGRLRLRKMCWSHGQGEFAERSRQAERR